MEHDAQCAHCDTHSRTLRPQPLIAAHRHTVPRRAFGPALPNDGGAKLKAPSLFKVDRVKANRGGVTLLAALLAVLFFLRPAPLHAAPRLQTATGSAPQLYLLPQNPTSTNIIADTHIVTLRVLDDLTAPTVQVDGTYRLRNPASEAATVPFRLLLGGDTALGAIQGVSLTRDGEPLGLVQTDDGGFVGELVLNAGARTTLRLVYQTPLGSGSLATLRYAPAVLNGWAGNISLRVEFLVPVSIPPESWIETTPATWEYGVTTERGINNVRWLYDFSAPDEALRLQFIGPQRWAEIRDATAAATPDAALPIFERLGNLYRDLARSAEQPAVRERFYAQAVAAYSAGLNSRGQALATPTERAALHIGLADLYRRRLVEVDPAEQMRYADLLVGEITQALALLPGDHPRRAELGQWQVDGLRLQFNQAKSQEDWLRALALLDQIAGAGAADAAALAEERSSILIQQALDLMATGNREAALAIAGDQITAETLTPPLQSYGLFSAWQITVTASPSTIQLVALAEPYPDRLDPARTALQEVTKIWQDGLATAGHAHQVSLSETTTEAGAAALRLQIDFPAGGNGALLARLLPPRPDYALLRTLLTQLAPTITERSGVVWLQVDLRQPMDLTPVAGEWNALAAGLEQQAAGFEAQAGQINSGDSAGAAAALTARIQAVNYQAAATEWRTLARRSSLLFTFHVDDPLATRLKGVAPGRAWTVTAAAPSQTFLFQTQVLSLGRLLTGGVFAMLALVAVAGVLWSLL